MNRRHFIYSTGAIVTASVFYSYFLSVSDESKEMKRPNPSDFSIPIEKAMAYGINASNPHNTQAWKFNILTDNSMLLFIDENRILPATDPITRQIHIGCGCFIEMVKIGMTKEGYSTKIEYFPNGYYDLSSTGKLPVAKIMFNRDSNVQISQLSKDMLTRKTSRKLYSNDIIDSTTWHEILLLIGDNQSAFELITSTKNLNIIRPLLADGMEIESYTYRTHEESRKWFRENDKKIAEKRDGINLPGNGISGIKKWFAERQLKGLKKDDWHSKKTNEYALKSHRKRVEKSPNIITLKTTTNTPLDWLKAGQDYCRLQLACISKGFFMHPLSQVLQEFEEMDTLRKRFEKEMNVQENEKIQMVVRVGKSEKPYLTYRRKVSAFQKNA
jgi:hypothetical protein